MRLLGVVLAWTCVAQAAGPTTLAVDLTQLGERDFATVDGLGLENRATVRLVQEGFAVVSLRAAPQVVVRVVGGAQTLELSAEGPGGRAVRTVRRGGLTVSELHLEVCQKLVELARAVSVAREEPPAPPAPTLEPAPQPAPEIAAARPSGVSLSAGAGALIRVGGVDPWFTVGAVWRRERVHPTLQAGLSLSSASGVAITEGALLIGVTLAWALLPTLEGQLGMLAGGTLHAYRSTSPWIADSGLRADALAVVPLALEWRPARAVVLTLWVAPGVSSRPREHLEQTTVLWSRGAARLETGVKVGVSFE